MKPKLLIVFPSPHLAYSPTTINLYDALDAHFEVTILTPLPFFKVRRLEGRRVEYVPIPYWLFRLAQSINYRLKRYGGRDFQLPTWLSAWCVLRAARRHPWTEAIGIDFFGAWVVQRLRGHGHMVSLEIEDDNPFRKHVDTGRIDSLIIQTQERYDYLFKGTGVPRFLVQNAPVYSPPSAAARDCHPQELLFCGTAKSEFGFYHCLDFLVRYPEFRLTVQGHVSEGEHRRMEREYSSLVSSGRITINEAYLEVADLIAYSSRFPLGFCCYDLTAPGMDNFNYRSAPSGKLFTYLAAGVPVIGSELPGLASVREFETGVLIPEFTPDAIRAAVDLILSDHGRLRANCLRAARHFSFDKTVAPFIQALTAMTDADTR